jgi:hypothetical protein
METRNKNSPFCPKYGLLPGGKNNNNNETKQKTVA